MSVRPFESFLVEQIFAGAEKNIKPGFRYQFKSPDNENSVHLYQEMIKHSKATIVANNGIPLPYISLSSCKIIPVIHSENKAAKFSGFTENYISYLRDEIAGQSGEFKGCALVVIHNSLLDTLINSAEDLAHNGHVWSPKNIKENLKVLIEKKGKRKDVLLCLLDEQFDSICQDGATMFGFNALYNSVEKGEFRFSELGMFEDPLVIEMKGNKKQIKKRLEENIALFDEISYEVEHYSEQLHDRLKSFGEKFINLHFSDPESWKNIEFEAFLQEKKRNSQQLLVLEEEQVNEGATIFARSCKETKAGMRDRHLIIELDEGVNDFELKLIFQGADNLDKNQLKIIPTKALNKEEIITSHNGMKTSRVNLKATYNNEPLYFNLKLNRENKSEVYNFHCLIVRKGEFFIEPFKNIFLIEHTKKRLTISTDNNKLQIRPIDGLTCSLDDVNKVINVEDFAYVDFEALTNESDQINFSIKSNGNKLTFNVEGTIGSDSLSLPILLNRGRYYKLFNDEYNGEFYSKKGKVSIDNTDFVITALRLKLLRWEEEFIQNKLVSLYDNGSTTLDELKEIDNDIYIAYRDLFNYLDKRNTTPSLASWGDEFTKLVQDIIDSCISYYESIESGHMLTPSHKTILTIGLIKLEGDEYYTPYHPLILAYYLNLRNTIYKDDSFSKLPDITFERLLPKGFIPYVYHPDYGFSYNQQVKENAFWINSVPQEKSSLLFVRKLVKEKIDEFKIAFSRLFCGSENSIILNAINQENANEIFMGLVDYVKSNLELPLSIHVNLYDDEFTFNAFDRFAATSSYDELKLWLELDKNKKSREIADTIIDILRTRLTYSKFTNKETANTGQEYAHISFFRNNNKVECVDVAIENMESSIACGGLLAGDASKNESGSYFTGFGLKNIAYKEHPHLLIAKYIGALSKPALKPNTQYNETQTIALAVKDNFKDQLKRSYENSIWTTIIDPKVTLDFFHTNDDVVLIHYSDQYTSSSSYDAITVTAQRALFEKIIKQGDAGQLNEFNAFNGDWLLKMLTCAASINKERKGIVGAYKFVTSLLYKSDITWVPLSVAEMIRVSGNIGLKMSDSEFSRNVQGYKKGEISDDILLVGFKGQEMYLLPVEVKTGSLPDYKKAVKQSKELLRYLSEDLLGNKNIASKLYRSLFMRQVLMQIDKYKLYKVFASDYFDELLNKKEEWLKGDFTLATITNYPDGFVVSHLESANCLQPEYKMDEGILKINLPMGLLPRLVETPFQEIVNELDIIKLCHVPDEYVLRGKTQSATKFITAKDPSIEKHENNQIELNTPTELDDQDSKVVEIQSIPSDPPIQPSSGINLQVLFGHDAVTQEPLNWEPTNTAKFMNTNTGIIGTMGTGKTQFTKSVITQIYRNQADNLNSGPIGVLIFDYKSDYVDDKFQQATNGKKFNLHKLPYNPLSLFGDTPMLPVHTARGFSETVGKAFNLGQKQQLKLRKLVGEAYELAGIRKSESSTWSKPAPTISDVWTLFIETDPDEDSLYAALESLCDLEIFEDDNSKCMSLYELIDGIMVIELAGYPTEIQNLVIALTLDLFYSQMQKKGKPSVLGDFRQITKMILVDEADNFMSQNFVSLRKVLKEGREYGVGVILSTQDITHFQTGENDYSNYILTWVIHRVGKIKSQELKAMFGVNEKNEQESLMETIRKLEKHQSLYIDGSKKFVLMRDKAFWELL